MVKARLIWVVLLASAVTAVRSEDAADEVAEASFTRGRECRSADCASPILAQSEEAPAVDRDWCNVVGSSAMFDADDPAIKLIEISVASEDSDIRVERTVNVEGLYRVTSTGVLMPKTEGALRVIEFSRLGEGDSKP